MCFIAIEGGGIFRLSLKIVSDVFDWPEYVDFPVSLICPLKSVDGNECRSFD